MRDERGTALLEVIILGFAMVAVVVPVILTAAALSDAQARVDAAALDAASWYARHGELPDDVDTEIAVTVDSSAATVHVEAEVVVSVVAIGGLRWNIPVVGRSSPSISPYRSKR